MISIGTPAARPGRVNVVSLKGGIDLKTAAANFLANFPACVADFETELSHPQSRGTLGGGVWSSPSPRYIWRGSRAWPTELPDEEMSGSAAPATGRATSG